MQFLNNRDEEVQVLAFNEKTFQFHSYKVVHKVEIVGSPKKVEIIKQTLPGNKVDQSDNAPLTPAMSPLRESTPFTPAMQPKRSNRDQALLSNIGRWGEKFADTYLPKEFAEYSIKWMNDKVESGCPYDFLLTHRTNGTLLYVEVKATSASFSSRYITFWISENEWNFARQHGQNYYIIQVFGYPSPSPEVVQMQNPFELYARGIIDINFERTTVRCDTQALST